jgi:hypothetical protein
VAYYQARGKLEDAQRMITEAMSQLRLAAGAQGPNARSANQAITDIEPLAKALEEGLRRSLLGLKSPVPEEVPVPTPAPAAETKTEPVPSNQAADASTAL